ncbi:nucleoprotein TPR isoform X3 [Anoplophora glabripennis]|uniref:nucleoprotein TPR isoform X3 n=1 Tax=Anoplophora glabripennis TaxID=217634 RepID=UPI0008735ADC|nr:nucleoprotein TPR isoform X3 [Anoplophora glabripennis]
MELPSIFVSILTEEDWQAVPAEVGKKIENFVSEKFEEFITSKALLETKHFNTDQSLGELKAQNEKLEQEYESLKSKLEVASNTISEYESQLSVLTTDINKLHTQCNKLEAETAEYRHQRNLAVDERDEHLKMIQRRNGEVERLQLEINTLTKQLESAVNSKCEALAQADEVASMKIRLEYREKRIEQERTLLNSQMESLTQELNQRTEELLNMRRDNTSRCIQLETKLTEKMQELTVATEQIKSLTDLNNNLVTRNEELSQKMINQREVDAKMNESYVYEIEAKTKMANAYKSMYEESQQHSEELKEALSEVQQLLKTATEQYGELETKHKESQLAHEEIIAKKNECIAMLKKELETANELLENFKSDQLNRDVEGLSSTAATASKLIKSGLSYSEVYSKYVNITEQYTNKEEECSRLNNYISCIVREIEEKGPLIKKLREDYSNTLDANDALKESNDALLNEVQQLREANSECKRLQGVAMRENERLKKEVTDLARQVVHLLHEVEQSRIGGSSSTSTDNDLSDSISSADIITKKLVTFNDISELQATNQKLLALVRELTERQEEVESFDPAAISNLKMKLEDLRESQNELLEEKDRQNKMMGTLRNQRDMYKNLYTQAIKATGEDVPMQLERSFLPDGSEAKMQTDAEAQLEEKVRELAGQIEKLNKQVEHLKEENETYRKEKSANEKILLEQLDNMRGEVKELTRLNCKLSSHADVNEEKFKVMQNNTEIYKKQITALEKQNRIYSEAIIKHEQAATYLKDETLQCQTKLSKAEVLLGNLQKENALLKDAEQRLVKERESWKRESHQQNLIKTNIELIKATLERTDAEGRLKLESRLDEAHRECSALRRRLQEEQDHFRQLTEHLEKQTHEAQKRMEEEREQAEKLRKELAETREELITKTAQIEELGKKLKMGLFTVADSNAETQKIRELELRLSDAEAEVNSAKAKLKTAKEASDEYFNVAEAAEKQVKESLEQQERLQQEIEKQKALVKEWQEKCSELEGELSIQMDDQDITNADIKSKSSQLQEELGVKTMDLRTAREQLESARSENKSLIEQLKAVENKYAREVTLHSVDLQALTSMKEELDKALGVTKKLESEKEQAVEALTQNKTNWEEQEKIFQKEKEELENRFKDMDSQNSLLHDQIQALNTQLTILQSQASGDQNQSFGDASFNKSFTEEEAKSSEQLLKIVKYLRQEKDIAVSKADIIEAEHSRLRSQFDMLNKQLEEAKATVELERQKTEVTVVSAAKHGEVLRKLETLNAITDSNRTLRQERDTLLTQITELRERAERLEAEVAPLQEKNRDLTTKADQMQNENISLRAECTRWRQRANMLIEKTNRTSPEDWKKLQTERETLAKQLTIERSTTTKLNDEINNLKQDKSKLEEQLKSLRAQNNQLSEELSKTRDEVNSLQTQVTQLTNTVDQHSTEILKYKEENRLLTEDTAGKDVTITELKGNLAQVRKIAKKYKIQCEDQLKEIEALKQQGEQRESEQNSNAERQEQLMQEQRSELEERIAQMETSHKESIDTLNQQVSSTSEQIETYKKEIENLKQISLEKEERFKNLFKNAKERIVSLTEQNNNLKEELHKQDRPARSDGDGAVEGTSKNEELLEKIAALERERDELNEERLQEKEKYTSEIDGLTQRVNQLQRQLGLQQGSKPTTSSASSEKSATERPTADIKPMAGHSTNTQTQSVPIQPWRSGGEPPLASIRPMSAQLRTVAVLPTSQSPSAVMVPPQQQVHTTGSSTIEALSSSPTSSHTDYVPATSSASAALLGPRQVAVPPTQSSQDVEDEDNNMQVQTAPQTQAVALVLPRVEPPSSGPTQEQGTSSSSSSNTVTTTQAGLKRQRDADTDSCQADEQGKTQQQSKRTRVQAGTVSDSGLEVEYQVPTSSQRDHDDDNVIVVESDDEGGADEGEGADDDQEDPDTEGYDMEGMEQDNYEDADCQEVEDEEEAGNEVEVIEDSSEVPNQSERSIQESPEEENSEQAQSEAISSGTDGSGGITISQASTSVSLTVPSFSRTRPVAPLPSRQQQSHLLLPQSLEDGGDDGIVPSTPTLYVPRRSDGFGEAVSSPHVPTSGRFTFSESAQLNVPGSSEIVPEQSLEAGSLDDTSTGRSVPTTPLQSSPQEAVPAGDEQGSSQTTQSDGQKDCG